MRGHPILASVYDALNRPLEQAWLRDRRARLLADVSGVVHDVGAGTGANLEHLHRAAHVVAAEPDPAMRKRLARKLRGAPGSVEMTAAPAESLPYADETFDAVVFTLVLCTVPSPERALHEARRLLKPDGRLVVLEHVRSLGSRGLWQDRVAPAWSLVWAGCRPNRDVAAAVESMGFAFLCREIVDPLLRWVPTGPWLAAVARRADHSGGSGTK